MCVMINALEEWDDVALRGYRGVLRGLMNHDSSLLYLMSKAGWWDD